MTPAEWGAFWGLAVPLAIAAIAAVIDWVAVWVGGTTGRRVERVAKPAVLVALLAAALLRTRGRPRRRPPGRGWSSGSSRPSWATCCCCHRAGSCRGSWRSWRPISRISSRSSSCRARSRGWWSGSRGRRSSSLTVGRALVRAAARLGLAVPVALYLVAITLMAVAATRTGEAVAIAGAWLFVASDAMLGWGRLRAPQPGLPRGGGRAQRVAVMVTYHLGQGLIVLALLA